MRTSTASAPSAAARLVARDRRPRRLAAGAGDERPAARHRVARRRRSRGRSRRRRAAPLRRSSRARRSRSAASPASARAPRCSRPVSTRSRSSNGVGIGAKTPRQIHRMVIVDARRAHVARAARLCSTRFKPEHDQEHRRRRTEQPRESRRTTRMLSTRPAASCPSWRPDRETRGRRTTASPRRR